MPVKSKSRLVKGCLAKSCAPPPVGTGGSLSFKQKAAKVSGSTRKTRTSNTAVKKAAATAKKRSASTGSDSARSSGGGGVRPADQLKKVSREIVAENASEKEVTRQSQHAIDTYGVSQSKPRVVSKEEFDRLAKESPDAVLHRVASQSSIDNFVRGDRLKLDVGGALHGEGIYFAAGRRSLSHVIQMYGDRGATMTAVVDRSTIAPVSEIREVQSALEHLAMKKFPDQLWGKNRPPKVSAKAMKAAQEIWDAIGETLTKDNWFNSGMIYSQDQIALAMGYKGYEIQSAEFKTGTYVVILDRSAVTVPDDL